MKFRLRWSLAMLAALALPMGLTVSLYAHAAEGSFDRTLKVTGPVELNVRTGSGNIDVRTGDASSVHVRGMIRVNGGWHISAEEAERKVRALESNPPLEQTGNTIRIGHIEDAALRRHVSISYELVVPAETRLTSHTGSGDQSITGLGGPVRADTGSGNLKISNISGTVRADTGSGDVELGSVKGDVYAETGSGNIRAAGCGSAFVASTGSGDVRLEQTGPGSVSAESGSGNLEVSGAHGSVNFHTGSGDITAQGELVAAWKLDTGSGNVTVRLSGQPAFDLYAHTGSGEITTNHPITVQGKVGRHELRGKVRGGGYLLDAGTGSGDIRIK